MVQQGMLGRLVSAVACFFAGHDWKFLRFGARHKGKGPKRAAVSIGTAYFTVDLRNTDPDQMMVGLMDPIAKMARMPDSSPMDLPGF